jgi:putative glutamine amidotransferase
MKTAPLILVSPCSQKQGIEFEDASLSLSNRYTEAVFMAGGLPVISPLTTTMGFATEMIGRTDGLMLTGGDDVEVSRYRKNLPPELAATVSEPERERDVLELELIKECFRQRKPVFAICRGHQILNVALGGTLIVDIGLEVKDALDHKQMARKMEPVHEVSLTPGSGLAMMTSQQELGVNSTHHQAIAQVAPTLQVTARSRDGVVEAMELKDPAMLPFLLSVQFHPERLWDRYPVFLRLFQQFVKACQAGRRN